LPAVARSRVQVRHAGRCYYFFADFSAISKDDDVTFAKWMTREIGVADGSRFEFLPPRRSAGKK